METPKRYEVIVQFPMLLSAVSEVKAKELAKRLVELSMTASDTAKIISIKPITL